MNKISKKILLIICLIIGLILVYLTRSLYLNYFSKTNSDSNPDFITKTEEQTNYKDISVYTREEWQNDKRSLLYISYPVTENININKGLEIMAQKFIDEYREVSKNQEDAYQNYLQETGKIAVSLSTEYIQHFDISLATDKYLLFIFDRYRNTGGTGSDDSSSVLFNRETGQQLPLSNIFSDNNYLEILSSKSRLILIGRLETEAESLDFSNETAKREWRERREDQINIGTAANSQNFDSLVISSDNKLIIIFDKYQVAPGSDGVVRVEVPLTELSQILAPEIKEIVNINNQSSEKSPDENKITKEDSMKSVDRAKEKCVALTFDDGPSIYTNKLLDILKEHDVNASFFVIGRSAKIQPDTIKRIIQEGHVIGNHSWDHKDLTKLSPELIQKQITYTDKLIKTITDYDITLLRPPYGAYNTSTQENIDKTLILWNIDPEDWKEKDVEIIIERMSMAEAGSIILAHDIYPSTIAAIPQVIENLKWKGLTFVTIDELFAPQTFKKGQALRYRPS